MHEEMIQDLGESHTHGCLDHERRGGEAAGRIFFSHTQPSLFSLSTETLSPSIPVMHVPLRPRDIVEGDKLGMAGWKRADLTAAALFVVSDTLGRLSNVNFTTIL